MSKKLSPIEQESKLKVLQNCMDDMDGMMGEGLDNKKKMKASMPKKGKESVSGDELIKSLSGDESEESEVEESEESEDEEMSEEEIDAKIKELLAKKKVK